ncbi:hypothetical protein B0A48_17615 [Cryoendolithus antarcticus]|uniref:Uncharacterized protein n=1 Tax=Cryoendolithus antarcticus TaxID=1507870 RepID=A0A1V8SBB8_9PEZI|nr:hypothetical protein B0A48_17615 [Cryoendolithus antarcticus]
MEPPDQDPAIAFEVDDMTRNAVHALLIQNHNIFKRCTTEERNLTGLYHLTPATHLVQTFPKTFDYESITKDKAAMSVADNKAHWAALKGLGRGTGRLAALPCHDVAAAFSRIKLKLAQLMGRGNSPEKAASLYSDHGDQRVELR